MGEEKINEGTLEINFQDAKKDEWPWIENATDWNIGKQGNEELILCEICHIISIYMMIWNLRISRTKENFKPFPERKSK